MVPAPLKARGVVVMLHPERVRAKLGIDLNTELGLGGDGQLVVRIAGGLLGGSKVLELERGELTIARCAEGLTLAGGPITELVLRTDPASAVHRTWTERAPFGLGPDWTLVGTGTVQVLTLEDPRKPPRATPLGRARTTTTVWRRTDGTLRLDAVQDVVELLPEGVHAVATVLGAKATVVHAFRPGVDGWRIGYRLNLGDAQLPPTGPAPDAVVAGRFVGRVGGEPIEAALAARTAGILHLFDSDGVSLASAPLATARFTSEPRLLILGPQLDLIADLPPEVSRRLVEGTPEDPELLELAGSSHQGTGAVRARLLEGVVTLTGTREHRVAIADLDPGALTVERDGEVGRLVLGAVAVRGRVEALGRLRESVLAQGGRAVLARADLDQLTASWRTLRIERWLWLLYGAVFVTERLLTDPLAQEPGEDADRLARRRAVTDALVVTEQVRAVRLRLGLAPLAFPPLLASEEPDRPLDGARQHLRRVAEDLEFALAEVDRVVLRLDGLGSRAATGSPSLDPAPAPLPPGSVRKVLEQLQRDFSARMALDRVGPQVRPAWGLLTSVTAMAAAETRSWLTAWLDQRPISGSGSGSASHPTRDVVTEQILTLHSGRTAPVDAVPGAVVGDLVDQMRGAMDQAAVGLVERYTGRGPRPSGPS